MEEQIAKLTETLWESCAGRDAGVVIGAGFNLIQTAMNAVPDKRVLKAVAMTLRNQADTLDKMAGADRH